MASCGAGIVLVVLVLSLAVPSLATVYTVGDSAGWSLGVDYTTWASAQTFVVGDSLVFNYGSSHSVDEVSPSDYSTCTVGNAITSDSTGATTITLKTAGVHNFICGAMGHCSSGMKLSVTVGSGTATPSGTPPSSTTTTPTAPAGTNTGVITPPSRSSYTPNSSPGTSLSAFVVAVFVTLVAVFMFVLV